MKLPGKHDHINEPDDVHEGHDDADESHDGEEEVCQHDEADDEHADHGEGQVAAQLPPDDLVRLPRGVDDGVDEGVGEVGAAHHGVDRRLAGRLLRLGGERPVQGGPTEFYSRN